MQTTSPRQNMRNYLPRRFILTLAIIGALGSFSSILAQTGSKNANNPLILESTPFEAESLGLRMNLPTGASVIAERAGGQVSLLVSDDPASPTWTVRIQRMVSRGTNSASAQIDDLLRELRANGERLDVISNNPITTASGPGHLCLTTRNAHGSQPYVSGWMLVPSGDDTFLVFTIQTLPEHLPRIRPLLEASFATVALRSSADIAAERKSLLDAGEFFIRSVNAEQLRSHVGASSWYRIYRQTEGGPREVGYSLLEVVEAKRGELEPKKPEAEYDASERAPGIMIRAQGRIVVNPERGVYYDSIALYWMAWDQSEEAWTIRGTHRQGEAERSEAETGVRTPIYVSGTLPQPRLTVIKSDNTRNTRDAHDWDVPQVYLSQPLHWLIGRLLPKDVDRDQHYSYYFYNFATGQLSLRSDTWGPANDGSGHYKLATRTASDAPIVTAVYTRTGELVMRTHPDGSITEPSTVDAIQKLWTAQNLNTGRPKR